ncbi:MAG TPA: CHAT domain-containing protein, partial [Roseiflexaceae bacterium]|nr:CHAT domain-containing protein [Roseiflexaceae bacterium]
MFKEYLDFEIAISPASGRRYRVIVSGPGGDAPPTTIALPPKTPRYQALAEALARLDTNEAALVELGRILFRTLFQGPIKDVYTRAQGQLKPEQGLRLRFNIDPTLGQVVALPWEFLADPDQPGPMAMLDAPIVRYLPQQAVIPSLATTLPLKVLVTGAVTPPEPNVEQELEEVRSALTGLGHHVDITVEPHLTKAKLREWLRRGFHVWHFIGHGGATKDGMTGTLLFEDATGSSEAVTATELGSMLFRKGVRLIILDACNSAKLMSDTFRSVAPALIQAQVPAVVAMQFTVPQEVTRAFAGEFYRALAQGFPIDACVTEGRVAVMNATGLRN